MKRTSMLLILACVLAVDLVIVLLHPHRAPDPLPPVLAEDIPSPVVPPLPVAPEATPAAVAATPEKPVAAPTEQEAAPTEPTAAPSRRFGTDQARATEYLRQQLAPLAPEEPLEIHVVLQTPEALSSFLRDFSPLRPPHQVGRNLIVSLPKREVERLLAAIPEYLSAVEPKAVGRLLNKVATGDLFLGLTALRPTEDLGGLDGSGEIVAIYDTGISTGVASTFHPDLLPNLFGMTVVPELGTVATTLTPADIHGHGTHVAGSVASLGNKYPETRGAAPGALLFFHRIIDNDKYFPATYEAQTFFARSLTIGAAIISCSWAYSPISGGLGYYHPNSENLDDFVWNHPEALVCFAVGNEGKDANSDGVIDLNSVYSLEAQAKNILTVGAQETYRTNVNSPYSTTTYPAAPISGESSVKPADGEHCGMAAFSSRGPLACGRIAPMLVSPGTGICSSQRTGSSTYMRGTSMATPLTAGSAAVLRQYLRQVEGIEVPTAALLRAGLILCTETLTPGQYGTDATREIPEESPNNVEGWGALHLGKMLSNGQTLGFADRLTLMATNQSTAITIPAVEAGSELVVVLSWIDAPGNAGKLVNDYDLTLTAPDGSTYTLNDHTNPIERLRIPSAQAGTYTATLTLSTFAQGGTGNLAALAWRAKTAAGTKALPAKPLPETTETVTLTIAQPANTTAYIDFPLYPAPGQHTITKGESLHLFAAPALARDASDPRLLCGWTLQKADGTFQQGTSTDFILTLDQDATLRWHTLFPGFFFRLR